jgi:hypothetical protein
MSEKPPLSIEPGDIVILDNSNVYEPPRFDAHKIASVSAKTVTVFEHRYGSGAPPRRTDRCKVFAVFPQGVDLTEANEALEALKLVEHAAVRAARDAYKASVAELARQALLGEQQ